VRKSGGLLRWENAPHSTGVNVDSGISSFLESECGKKLLADYAMAKECVKLTPKHLPLGCPPAVELRRALFERPLKVLFELERELHERTCPSCPRKDVVLSGWGSLKQSILVRDITASKLEGILAVSAIVRSISRRQRIEPFMIRMCCKGVEPCADVVASPDSNPYIEAMELLECEKPKPDWRSSVFKDLAVVKLEDLPEKLPFGSIPEAWRFHAHGSLARNIKPGDKGVFYVTLLPKRDRSGWKLVPVILGYDLIEEEPLKVLGITPSVEEARKVMQKYERWRISLLASIAPNICCLFRLKEALLLSILGGVEEEGPGGRVRGRVHQLIISDPSIGKTTTLEYLRKVFPKFEIVSGASSSGVGLTVSLNKSQGGEWEVIAGAIPTVGDGVVAVDEIDKLSDEDRKHLNTVMEEGVIRLAKAGITTTIRAPATIIGSGNPKSGRYDPTQPITKNVNVPADLLSRFDLIWVLTARDVIPPGMSPEEYAELVSAFAMRGHEIAPPIPPEEVRTFLLGARQLKPKMSREAEQLLRDYFKKLYTASLSSEELPLMITPRQLGSLRRLAQAYAKLFLSDVVTERHARLAVQIFSESLATFGIDPGFGVPDMRAPVIGAFRSKEELIEAVVNAVLSEVSARGAGNEVVISKEHVLKKLEKFPLSRRYSKEKLAREILAQIMTRLQRQGKTVAWKDRDRIMAYF
jgi:replicative DNA helicase Mcm